jgi:hypothetical protein
MDRESEHQPITANHNSEGLGNSVEAKDAVSTSPTSDSGKASQILTAARRNDLHELAALATSPGGLLEDELRRIACTSASSISCLSRHCSPRPAGPVTADTIYARARLARV